ncbi:hypothetical protein GCM10010271_24160 [Streptomyces kurssanovii]|nr:hypothetical protein GCM10010271_24160 [Streptomyces kurssanovii]
MGDDALAEPGGVGALAEGLDDAGDLAAGDRRQFHGDRVRAPRALAQSGVEEMDTGGGDGDPYLAGAGYGVVGRLVGQVLRGAEGVQADGVHGVGSLVTGSTVLVSSGPLFNLKRA